MYALLHIFQSCKVSWLKTVQGRFWALDDLYQLIFTDQLIFKYDDFLQPNLN